MSFDISTLPDDIKSLKNIILIQQADFNDTKKQYKNKIEKQSAEIIYQKKGYEEKKIEYGSRILYLEEQLKLFKDKFFNRTSEKLSPEEMGQMRLFNEIESIIQEEKKSEYTVIPEHRRKRGRKSLPKDLPREIVIHDLSKEEKIHGCGREMKFIGFEKSEQLETIPAQIKVIEHHYYKYACPCEGVDTEGKEGAIRIAPREPAMIPGSIVTPGLLAFTLTNKFCDSLPFYRQEKIFDRLGVAITRQSMCGWAIKAAKKCEPLKELMKNEILKGCFIGMDETTVQVLSEADRKNTTKSYMWVTRGGQDPEKPILLYEYFPTRSAEYIRNFIKNYKGYLQCDGYKAYNVAVEGKNIKLAGCMSHVRRKYYDVVKVSKNEISAQMGLSYIRKLYAIESEFRNEKYTFEEIRKIRQKRSKPILEEFKKWLDKRVTEIPPKSLLGKAINYTLNEWTKLLVYLEDGRIPIDNNLLENAIRPFVLGRKNWLFSGNPVGAKASALIYSLIETAKACGLEPYWYLLYLFKRLPKAKIKDDYRKLLPYNVDDPSIKSYSVKKYRG
jgi:transposase